MADAQPDFLERQVAAFLQSIDGGGAEGPSLAEDLKFQVSRARGGSAQGSVPSQQGSVLNMSTYC